MYGRHSATKGHNYPQTWYEGVATVMLERAGHGSDDLLERAGHASDDLLERVLATRELDEVRVDEVALARIARERDEATRRLTETRDTAGWQARMTQLDAEEAGARAVVTHHLSNAEAAAYVRDLPSLWRDADPAARKTLAEALWVEFSALGWQKVTYTWSRHALELGLGRLVPGEIMLTDDEVSLVGARGVEPPVVGSSAAARWSWGPSARHTAWIASPDPAKRPRRISMGRALYG